MKIRIYFDINIQSEIRRFIKYQLKLKLYSERVCDILKFSTIEFEIHSNTTIDEKKIQNQTNSLRSFSLET